MTRNRIQSFTCQDEGRVDRASGDLVPRSVFSLPDTVIEVEGRGLVKKSFRVRPGDRVTVSWKEEVMEGLVAEDIPLDVIWEDESILVIDKPAGMVVHPGAGNWSGTLVNALLFRYGIDFSTSADEDDDETADPVPRPGIVHRLDKDTSGGMVIAKTAQAHRCLCTQFASHTNEKVYIALVKGLFHKRRGTIDAPIVRKAQDRKLFTTSPDPLKGKRAVTHYTVLNQGRGVSFVRLRIETGRTHQIRVHMQSIGHPVLGDPLYSRPDSVFKDTGLCLHALSLTIDHPVTGERMTFRSRMPERIHRVLEEILA